MPRIAIVGLLSALIWIAWCVLVITTLVPAIQIYVTMWGWLLAWVLCMLPVIILAIVATIRVRARS